MGTTRNIWANWPPLKSKRRRTFYDRESFGRISNAWNHAQRTRESQKFQIESAFASQSCKFNLRALRHALSYSSRAAWNLELVPVPKFPLVARHTLKNSASTAFRACAGQVNKHDNERNPPEPAGNPTSYLTLCMCEMLGTKDTMPQFPNVSCDSVLGHTWNWNNPFPWPLVL